MATVTVCQDGQYEPERDFRKRKKKDGRMIAIPEDYEAMNDGFTRKKVPSLTLGEKMRKLRGDLRMSLHDVSKATRIQVKYLEYLENGEYGHLPADVYVRGFLRSYARYLNIDEQTIIKQYERERNIQKNLGREVPKNIQSKALNISSLVITPQTLVIALIVLLVGGAFLYLFREFRSFASDPLLTILEPASNATVERSDIVLLGRTDRGAQVTVNQQPIYVANDGEFSDKLTLQPGLNTITVIAKNRFEKEKLVTLSIQANYVRTVSEPAADAATAVLELPLFHIDVSVSKKVEKVEVEADGVVVFSGTLEPKQSQHIEAKNQIVVTAESGAETLVSFNDRPAESLGPDRSAVKRVVFGQDGREPTKGVQ